MQTETVPMTPSVRRAPLEPEVHSPEPDTARLCEELATLTIEGFHLNYHLGTAVQHILCGACKLDDLQRARRHLDREICRIQKCEQIRERIHSAREARVATGGPAAASANGSPSSRGAGKGAAPLHPPGSRQLFGSFAEAERERQARHQKDPQREWAIVYEDHFYHLVPAVPAGGTEATEPIFDMRWLPRGLTIEQAREQLQKCRQQYAGEKLYLVTVSERFVIIRNLALVRGLDG